MERSWKCVEIIRDKVKEEQRSVFVREFTKSKWEKGTPQRKWGNDQKTHPIGDVSTGYTTDYTCRIHDSNRIEGE